MNIATIILDKPAQKVALIEGDRFVSYEELRQLVDRARANLAQAGLGIDGRLPIIAGNEIDFVVATLACLGLGAQVVPVRPTSPVPELERKLASVAASTVVVGREGSWLVDDGVDLGLTFIDIHAEPTIEAPQIVECDPDHPGFLMLTSGVASDAKVAILSHANISWAHGAIQGRGENGLQSKDITLGVLPFSHIFGLNMVLLATLCVGGTVVLQSRFDAEGSLDLIRRHGVTVLSGAPPMWRRWAELDAPADSLSTIVHASSGAAALPSSVFAGMRDKYGITVAEGYGLTETSPIVTWSRGIDVKPSSVGKVIEGCEVILADVDGTPVDTGDVGEVVIRGPGVFAGYLDSPSLTEAVLTTDGWFWTGDIGVFDDDGYLYIVDRVKDVVIVSGFNVYPSEVEMILAQHPGVRGAVAVGEEDLETGETVVAHVLGQVTAEELDAHARAHLSRYKCPTDYRFVDELPVAASGKLIRRALR